ncbi:Uncharacterized conserved protein YtfP, gamma-glutamylcyclotransferase (GGCT)/AIG2-like family [Balnearium lithotrophicum]|uniref:Uncharacterized conserved protein YtfP, gamma-glutamylcyclotransferase (GGCT)/AIG2-like family n=1 Tax=Balnearium lithotrophicum TaxID=223788 RepID=A0A521AC15_9BACT|nr:gamma-glutamylcyclotransferase family protein [Balnearium lithotrophicum]SMO32260.1 Uncharacterized conserved protein YtfP, gamma-glutamylcyclotransferase (GGCT)/AIG2-like family [Balnearium lithotrophicum]
MRYQLLFVYGTLMSGFSAHAFLVDSVFVSHGVLYGAKLVHLNDGYPGIIEGEGRVFGEVYRVDDLTLRAIDMFEDFNELFPEESYYIRKKKYVRLIPMSEFVEAWVYFLNPSLLSDLDFTEVPFGNWKEFLKKFLRM